MSFSSGNTNTTITLLDDNASSHSTTSTLSNGDSLTLTAAENSSQQHEIYNYKERKFKKYNHLQNAKCEDICFDLCRSLEILPTTRLLFGLRVYGEEGQWIMPDYTLTDGERYCFRMRYKVPNLGATLRTLDKNALNYLYCQMRTEMVEECIPEIQYPNHKAEVMGLGALDMFIDYLERIDTAENIAKNYKRYLPRKLVKSHGYFCKGKIRNAYRDLRELERTAENAKLSYVLQINKLAPKYLLETYSAHVEFIPGEQATEYYTHVNVKLDLYDTPEPGLKILEKTSSENLTWILVAKLESIYSLVNEDINKVRLEITEYPNGYRMRFQQKADLESFITYLGGYIRLTSKWLYALYPTPSVENLIKLKVHGPIGGNFSFTKIREKANRCGSYIIRECEKENDILYIDINTKTSDGYRQKCKMETFKIKRDISTSKWHFNDNIEGFSNLQLLADHIIRKCIGSVSQRFLIPPSEYDKPPLLLICLPKNFQSKKSDIEFSESELQRKRPQIFNPEKDLEWYKDSLRQCDDGKMVKMRADWSLGNNRAVTVTLKVLKNNENFKDFMELANLWSGIYSHQFVKLYGLTLSIPYTMVMEYCEYGPLNEFLLNQGNKVSVRALLEVVQGLVRGIVYMREFNIVHGYFRCSNLYVTKYEPEKNLLVAKISDPGYPRPYLQEELPWIPFEFYNDINKAKSDRQAELWAFATTIWEIFARGEPIRNATAKTLHAHWNDHGGILPQRNVPDTIYGIMMDGWSKDPDKRFNHQSIFARLRNIKELENYAKLERIISSETLSQHSDNSNRSDMQSVQSSSTSSVTEEAPLHQESPHSWFKDYSNSVARVNNGKVKFMEEIGKGHYGVVYKGKIFYDNSDQLTVAIKTFRRDVLDDSALMKDFEREIETMKTLDHPNIVKIIESIEDPVCIIMEFFECGSFGEYLTVNKPNLIDEILLKFALEIAQGMDYLREKGYIHRDLATRNILVDSGHVKISDFGLAQKADSNGYYTVETKRSVPIKWYAPESLETNKFSFHSDVWSYGVTMFETFSRGGIPDLDPGRDLTPKELLDRLKKGTRLKKPDECSQIVYDKLMLPCWRADPKLRPDFKQLINQIKLIKNENGELWH